MLISSSHWRSKHDFKIYKRLNVHFKTYTLKREDKIFDLKLPGEPYGSTKHLHAGIINYNVNIPTKLQEGCKTLIDSGLVVHFSFF